MCMCLACNADWYYWSHDLALVMCVVFCRSVCVSVCLSSVSTHQQPLQWSLTSRDAIWGSRLTWAQLSICYMVGAHWRQLANMLEWLHIGATWPICWNDCTLAPRGQYVGIIAHWRQLANMLVWLHIGASWLICWNDYVGGGDDVGCCYHCCNWSSKL